MKFTGSHGRPKGEAELAIVNDVSTLVELRAMLILSRTDEGMRDILAQALEYFILKDRPTLRDALTEYALDNAETEAQRRYRKMNTRYGL
jgi:hypothetical protein